MSAVATVGSKRTRLTLTAPRTAVRMVPVRRRREGRTPVLGRVRNDSLPENTRYRDDGCDIHPQCLSCPLPRCRYEEPGGLRALINEHRDRDIVRLRTAGTPVEELADRFRVSRRTVFRILGMAAQKRRAAENAPVPVFLRRAARTEAQCA